VVDGTGTQVHYEPDGLKNWEIEVRDFKWIHYRCWHKNGQLADESRFRDGLWDGPVVGYHDDGTKKYERTYSAGKLVGPSKTYDVRGRIHTIEDYDAPDHLKQTEHYDEKGKLVRIEMP
jgi:antitoxin component YwqK of YwqJK toxin-antitoxin module